MTKQTTNPVTLKTTKTTKENYKYTYTLKTMKVTSQRKQQNKIDGVKIHPEIGCLGGEGLGRLVSWKMATRGDRYLGGGVPRCGDAVSRVSGGQAQVAGWHSYDSSAQTPARLSHGLSHLPLLDASLSTPPQPLLAPSCPFLTHSLPFNT